MKSPDNDNRNDFKNGLNHELYKKETYNLIESAEKKHQLKMEKLRLMNIKFTISKMKFEMEREEKLTLR
jgi:hypothetical protein